MKTHNRVRLYLASVTLVVVQVASVLLAAPIAHAAAGNIAAPFENGTNWNICQGYNAGPYNTHKGNSAYGLDLTGAGCDSSAYGRKVLAPMSGTVAYYEPFPAYTGNLCINMPGGGSYSLAHINATVTSGAVTPGLPVGSIAAPQAGNNYMAHLHFQVWTTKNCYTSPGVPFDAAHGLRICGAPDLYDGGPVGVKNQGQWSGTPFTAQSCGVPAYPGVGSNATFKGVTQLTTNMRLYPNEYITSLNGQSVLIMQGDGNLVMYRGSSVAQWSSGTNNNPGAFLEVRSDGNVMIYRKDNTPIWWTGTNTVTRFTMQADGNLVGYDINNVWKWQSNTGSQPVWTYKGTERLNQWQRLTAGEYLKSIDKRYFLLMQNDGNLVLYSPGYHVLWSSGTNNNPGAYLEVQGDGNIVIYRTLSDRTQLWNTGTNNAFEFRVQDDGNLVAYSLINWVWQSWTGGRI